MKLHAKYLNFPHLELSNISQGILRLCEIIVTLLPKRCFSSMKNLMISRLFVSLCFLFLTSIAFSQQIMRFKVSAPDSVTVGHIQALFEDHPELVVRGANKGEITISNNDPETWDVNSIRQLLSTIHIAAVSFEQSDAIVESPKVVSRKLETAEFMVYGNCGMCKDRIERAARSIKGVVVAQWDEETQNLKIKYQPGMVQLQDVHQTIANVGHDTDQVKASDKIYEELHHCCKYERPSDKE